MTRALSGQAAALPVQRARGDAYPEGTYGRRAKEREYLEDEYDLPISGANFQVEHAHGYASTARHAPVPRRRNGRHEGEIFAYHETLDAHRDHPGTGSSLTNRSTGLNSRTYRDRQQEHLYNDDPYRSLELNQLEYNTLPSFHSATGSRDAEVADASYRRSLQGNPRTPYYDGSRNRQQTRSLRPGEQARLDSMRTSMREQREVPHAERVRVLRDEYGGSRFDEYPTRSRGSADGDELTDFFDEPRKKKHSSQYKELKRLARTPYKRDDELDLGRGRSQSPYIDDRGGRDSHRSHRRSKSSGRGLSDRDVYGSGSRYDAPPEDDYLLSQPSDMPFSSRPYDDDYDYRGRY